MKLHSAIVFFCALCIGLVAAEKATFDPSKLTFNGLIKKYGAKKAIRAHNLRAKALRNPSSALSIPDSKSTSLLEVAAAARAKATTKVKGAGGCEVCVYVVENKQMHQPFLCRGLKDPAYQQTCVTTLISLMWWLENQVYWINYGCQRQSTDGGSWEWVKPCPAHAVCSWIQNLYEREPFCPVDSKYRKPA